MRRQTGSSPEELSRQASSTERRPDEELDNLPANTKRDLAAIDSALATSIHLWLKRRKKNVRPKLSADQQHQLKECFELMDQDGSGAIGADELGAAFKLLGIGLRKAEVEQILDEVGMNADGEVEYPQFLEIMTVTLQRLAEEQAEDKSRSSQVPFSLMATAYRRKRLMEGIISGDKETMGQIVQLSERQAQEAALRDAATAAAAARKAGQERQNADGQDRPQKIKSSAVRRSMARLARMHVDEGLLMRMGPEERRLLNQVANQTQRQQQQQQPQAVATHFRQLAHTPLMPPSSPKTGLSRFTELQNKPSAGLPRHQLPLGSGAMTHRSARPSPSHAPERGGIQVPQMARRASTADNSCLPRLRSREAAALYSSSRQSSPAHQLPKHQQLLGVPQCFDIKFSRPTVNVSGIATGRCGTAGLPLPSATRPLRETSGVYMGL